MLTKSDLHQIDQVVGKRVAPLDRQLGKVEEKIDKVDKRVGDLEGKVDKVDKRVGDLEGKVDNVDKRVGDLEEKVDKVNKKVGNLEGSMDKLDKQMRKGFKDTRHTHNVIIGMFDREYMALRKRVDRIEVHLGLSPLSA